MLIFIFVLDDKVGQRVKILVTKSVFMEVMSGPNRTLHFSLMQAEFSMNLDEVKIHPLWICWWFLTCLTQFLTLWFHFWHHGFIFDMFFLSFVKKFMMTGMVKVDWGCGELLWSKCAGGKVFKLWRAVGLHNGGEWGGGTTVQNPPLYM